MKAIKTTYKGPTNTRGSRIIASDEDGNKVTTSYPYELSGEAVHRKAAEALRDKMGWKGNLISGSLKNGYVFVFTTLAEAVARDKEIRHNDEYAKQLALQQQGIPCAYCSSAWGHKVFCCLLNGGVERSY